MFTYAHAIRGDGIKYEFACQRVIHYKFILVFIQFNEEKYFFWVFNIFQLNCVKNTKNIIF